VLDTTGFFPPHEYSGEVYPIQAASFVSIVMYLTCTISNIYTTIFRVKQLNNRTQSMRLFNHFTRKTVV